MAIQQTTDVFAGEVFDPTAFGQTIVSICENFRFATNDPFDQIKLFTRLATYRSPVNIDDLDSYNPAPLMGQTGFVPQQLIPVIAASVKLAEDQTAALCRRIALGSLARACAAYNPTSVTEAIEILQVVVPAFDAEILYAGAQTDDLTYNNLTALRTAVVNDLESRGSALPEIVRINLSATLPSDVIAYDLYRDARRSLDLEIRSDCIHPLFMPHTFLALAS